jgi:MraZ protein
MQDQGFTGTIYGTLDAKGRVCVPASFRQILIAQETPGMFVMPALFDPAIECFGTTLKAFMQARYSDRDPLFSPEENDEESYFNANTFTLTFDENGRVRLPEKLIAHAGLKDRVVFVGNGRKFRICDPDRHDALAAARDARMLKSKGGVSPAASVPEAKP